MNVKILIDSIVRHTTVLVAQLATAGGTRAPLAHVANQVFLDLSRELEAQGISRKVGADMFGMALRTYLRRIQWLKESSTDRGRTLWEAVLGYLSENGLRSRAQVLQRFAQDEESLVRGVLHDLAESGLVFTSGSGAEHVFRATTTAEQTQMQALGPASGLDELVWAYIYREGPVDREQLDSFAASNPKALAPALQRLLDASRITHSDGSYSASSLEVLLDVDAGWEAAVYDHYQALVRTICQRLAPDSRAHVEREQVGGSTFTYDVWPGHPHEAEVLDTLARFRAAHTELFERVEAHNRQHPPPDRYEQVVVYGGQNVTIRDEAAEENSAEEKS